MTIDEEARQRLLGYLGSEALGSITSEDEATVTKVDTPEVGVYLHLLVMIYLLDQSQLEKGDLFAKVTPGTSRTEPGSGLTKFDLTCTLKTATGVGTPP